MRKKIKSLPNPYLKKIIISVLFLLCSQLKPQRTLTVGGTNWVVSVPAITEAGNNYVGTYESASNEILLNANVPLVLGSGKVTMHYEPNPIWNPSLLLRARRTGNGTTSCISCTITGGTTYTDILSTTEVELFRINAVVSLASYTNIPVQLELSGVSVTIPAASYSSRIVFTISAL